MGVILKEKDGTWWVFINHKGRRKSKKLGTDEKAARTIAGKIQAKLTLGEFNLIETEVPTFKAYSALWHENYAKALLRHFTAERYDYVLKKHIPASVGAMRLNDITRNDIKGLLLGLHKKGLSRASICLTRDVISGIMNHAIDADLITSNPVTGVIKSLKLSSKRGITIEPLTGEEVALFLSHCSEEYYPLFLCAFRTGLRLGELLALEWSDIDFNGKFIRISKSYRRGRVERTKTGKDRRVDMSDQLHEALQDLLKRRKQEAWAQDLQEPVKIVFHHKGEYMEQNYIRRVFKRILTKAGLREIRIHDTRHTFASLLLTNGESPAYVKEQLGHSSIQMTVDIYGHLIPSANRKAVNRLDSPQVDASPAQVAKTEKAQPIEIAPIIATMVRKGGLEPPQAHAH